LHQQLSDSVVCPVSISFSTSLRQLIPLPAIRAMLELDYTDFIFALVVAFFVFICLVVCMIWVVCKFNKSSGDIEAGSPRGSKVELKEMDHPKGFDDDSSNDSDDEDAVEYIRKLRQQNKFKSTSATTHGSPKPAVQAAAQSSNQNQPRVTKQQDQIFKELQARVKNPQLRRSALFDQTEARPPPENPELVELPVLSSNDSLPHVSSRADPASFSSANALPVQPDRKQRKQQEKMRLSVNIEDEPEKGTD